MNMVLLHWSKKIRLGNLLTPRQHNCSPLNNFLLENGFLFLV